MPHTKLTKQAKDLIFYHNFLLAKGGFKPTNLSGLTLWLDDPAIPSNIIEDGSNRVSQWTDISGNDNHLVQATGADQPLRTGSEIIFDGVSEFMNTSITPFASDLSGEVIFVLNDIGGAGVNIQPVTFNDNATDNNYIRIGYVSSDFIETTVQEGGAANQIRFGAATRGITVIYSFLSSGTAYKTEIDGVDKPFVSGTNNGNWVGDNASLDTMALGALDRLTPFFYNVGFKSVIYYNRQLTTAERFNVTTFLNNRFNVF